MEFILLLFVISICIFVYKYGKNQNNVSKEKEEANDSSSKIAIDKEENKKDVIIENDVLIENKTPQITVGQEADVINGIKDTDELKAIQRYEEQLALTISDRRWGKKKLLGRTEQYAFKAIMKARSDAGKARMTRVFSQVSLGEMVSHKEKEIFFSAANCKRVDFLITDSNFNYLTIIEINGTGHIKKESDKIRNLIKKKIAEYSGIKYLSIEVNTNDEETIFNKTYSICKSFFDSLD